MEKLKLVGSLFVSEVERSDVDDVGKITLIPASFGSWHHRSGAEVCV